LLSAAFQRAADATTTTSLVTVQPIEVCADDGSGCATPDIAGFETAANKIFSQAGLRAHPGLLADMPDGCVAEAESAAGGYQRTACANLFDDLLIALRLRLIPLSGLARRLDAGLVADELNQTWRQS